MFTATLLLLDKNTRQPLRDANTEIRLCFNTRTAILRPMQNTAWLQCKQGGVLIHAMETLSVSKDEILFQSFGAALTTYWEPLKLPAETSFQAHQNNVFVRAWIGTSWANGSYDPLSAGWIYPEEDLHICAGDHLHITWEYVPTVKYATDISATEKAYYQLILDHPDSYCPIQMEAIHGKWSASAVTGSVVSQEPILRVALNVTGCTQTGMFRVRHGVGYFPIEVRFSEKPGKITLLCSRGNWKRVGNLPYQLHREDRSWIATFLMQIDSQNFSAPEESLITITANNSGS